MYGKKIGQKQQKSKKKKIIEKLLECMKPYVKNKIDENSISKPSMQIHLKVYDASIFKYYGCA